MSLVKRWKLKTFEEVESTNKIVKQEIDKGTEPGYCAWAKSQTKGYGSHGNRWVSKEGGLYFSILLEPSSLEPDHLQGIPLKVAFCILDSLDEYGLEQEFVIKPPNDIITANSAYNSCDKFEKICGITTEVYKSKLCIGVGLNVDPPQSKIELEGEYVPVYMRDYFEDKLDIIDVLDSVLSAFNRGLEI